MQSLWGNERGPPLGVGSVPNRLSTILENPQQDSYYVGPEMEDGLCSLYIDMIPE